MKHSARQYALALYEATADKKKTAIPDLIKNFFNLVIKNNDLAKMNDIVEAFTNIWQEANGRLSAQLITKQPVTAEVLKNITAYVKTQTNCQDIDWQQSTDPAILGGLLIKYRDQVIDGTIKSNLLRLKDKLVN
ncbi:MAG: ATP synthase F1 subunit delta [bacterium]